MEKLIEQFWFEHYVRGGVCLLCDNTGYIKDDLKCLCPNAMALRRLEPDEV